MLYFYDVSIFVKLFIYSIRRTLKVFKTFVAYRTPIGPAVTLIHIINIYFVCIYSDTVFHLHLVTEVHRNIIKRHFTLLFRLLREFIPCNINYVGSSLDEYE